MAGKAELGKKSPQQGMGKVFLTAALGKHLSCVCHLGASTPDAQEGAVAEELSSLPPSRAGLSRDAVTNVRREQACPPHCCCSISGIYLGKAIHGLRSKQAQRNVPSSLPGQDVTVPHAAHH